MQEITSGDTEATQKDGEQEVVETIEETAEVAEPEVEETTEVDETDWKSEALKWKAIAARNKDKKPEVKPIEKSEPQGDVLSQKDLLAVVKANVDEDDISDVADYARLKQISVADALKTNFVKSLLNERGEERKSSQVANAGGSRRSSPAKLTGDQIVLNARKGIEPKTDEDWKAFHEARMKKS